ncbi:MAG: hypothetical protein ACYS8Z_15110 [Planctomycetota bacterium]|jgi:hypothetical protein
MSIQEKYLAGNTVFEVKDAISISVATSRPTEEPILIEEGYENFNIMLFGKTYYGLAQSEGIFEPQKAENGEYEKCFSANSMAYVKKAINASLQSKTQAMDASNWEPRLIEDNYRGFNIIRFGDRYYGLAQELGTFKPESYHNNDYYGCCRATSAEEVREMIDESAARSNKSGEPILIEEGYQVHNIVLYGDKYYAVPQDGEAFDTSRI